MIDVFEISCHKNASDTKSREIKGDSMGRRRRGDVDMSARWKRALAEAAELSGGWAALTRLCGFPRNFFYRVVREYHYPTVEIVLKVSAATGYRVPISEFVPEIASEILKEDRRNIIRANRRAAQRARRERGASSAEAEQVQV